MQPLATTSRSFDMTTSLVETAKHTCFLFHSRLRNSTSGGGGAHDDWLTICASQALVASRLATRLVLDAECPQCDDADLIAGLFMHLKQDSFVRLLAHAVHEAGMRADVSRLAYDVLLQLMSVPACLPNAAADAASSPLGFQFPMDAFLKHSEEIKRSYKRHESTTASSSMLLSSSSTTCYPLQRSSVATTSASRSTSATTTTNSSSSSNEHSSSAVVETSKLFEFYDYKLDEQSRQITQLMQTLTQHFSSNLLRDAEAKTLRAHIRALTENESRLHGERALLDAKVAELAAKCADMAKANGELEAKCAEYVSKYESRCVELSERNAELSGENKKLSVKLERLKQDMDSMEKSNEEAIENLQRAIESEIGAKKDLQLKLKEATREHQTRQRDLEARLAEKSGQLEEKISCCEKLQVEQDKLKSILSYVKENYKH